MAQPYRPELHNIDAVLRYYENSEAAAFSVYAGHKIDETVRRYSYDGEDKIKGGQELSEALQSVASNPNNTNTYLLVINKRVKNKLVPENTITFQLNDSRIMPYPAMAGPGNNSGEIAALRAELAALRMQLAAQAEDPDEDEDEDEDEDQNMLGSLLKNPEIQKQMIMGLMSLFGTPGKVNAVAGIDQPEAEKITRAIETLQKHDERLGDDLLILAEMAENSPAQFKMLLSMLRK